jgi:hypothetical protein
MFTFFVTFRRLSSRSVWRRRKKRNDLRKRYRKKESKPNKRKTRKNWNNWNKGSNERKKE